MTEETKDKVDNLAKLSTSAGGVSGVGLLLFAVVYGMPMFNEFRDEVAQLGDEVAGLKTEITKITTEMAIAKPVEIVKSVNLLSGEVADLKREVEQGILPVAEKRITAIERRVADLENNGK